MVDAPAPVTMLSAVARLAYDATGLDRTYVGLAPSGTPGPYAEVRHVSGPTPARRGDGQTLAWTGLAQVDVWEREADEDPTLTATLLAALDDGRVDDLGGARRWRTDLEQTQRTVDDQSPWVRNRLDVRLTVLR